LPALSPAGAETLTAEHRPAGLRLKRNAVILAALIANDLKTFAFSAGLARATEAGAPYIATRLATLGVAETALAIIILFALRERERRSAFGASDL